MFTNAKVGDIVVSEYYGKGIISNIDVNREPNYPVKVKFANFKVPVDYTLQGEYWYENSGMYGENSDHNVILLHNHNHNKLGSPGARHIVAMLASEYRVHKNIHIANWLASGREFARNANGKRVYAFTGRLVSAFHRYQEAKQLLGK